MTSLTRHPAPLDFGDTRAKAWTISKASEFENPATYDRHHRLNSLNIKENIGGDDVSDWVKVKISAAAAVRLITQGAIAELVNSRSQVVASSNDGYQSDFSATLKPGTYYLHFSSESSTPAAFTSKFSIAYS